MFYFLIVSWTLLPISWIAALGLETSNNYLSFLITIAGTIIGVVLALALNHSKEKQDAQSSFLRLLAAIDKEAENNLSNLMKTHTQSEQQGPSFHFCTTDVINSVILSGKDEVFKGDTLVAALFSTKSRIKSHESLSQETRQMHMRIAARLDPKEMNIAIQVDAALRKSSIQTAVMVDLLRQVIFLYKEEGMKADTPRLYKRLEAILEEEQKWVKKGLYSKQDFLDFVRNENHVLAPNYGRSSEQ